MSSIYIYYNKKKILLYLLFLLIFGFIYIAYIYNSILYDYVEFANLGFSVKVDVPFVFPKSLLRVSIFGLCMLIFVCFALYVVVRRLFHKGPVVIITPEGIEQFKYGFVSWKEISSISTQKVAGDKWIYIRLKNSAHNFNNYKNSLSTSYVILSPAWMYAEQINQMYDFYKEHISLN